MTRLAHTPPSHCAACFQAGAEKLYIDFEAAYDGPVIPGSPPMPVDDLILCDECLETAFTILDPKGQQQEIDRLNGLLDAAEQHTVSLEKQVHGLQETSNELVDHPIRKHRGRRGFELDDTDAKKVLHARRDDRVNKQNRKRKKVKA